MLIFTHNLRICGNLLIKFNDSPRFQTKHIYQCLVRLNRLFFDHNYQGMERMNLQENDPDTLQLLDELDKEWVRLWRKTALKETTANGFVHFILKPDHFWQQQKTPQRQCTKSK